MQPDSKLKLPVYQAAGRRSFLHGLGVVTVASGGAALACDVTWKATEAARVVSTEQQGTGSALPGATGYCLTDNIRSYYRTARY